MGIIVGGSGRQDAHPEGNNQVRCPFLREAQVKYCCASEYKKMIVRGREDEGSGRCSSPSYASCPAAKQHYEELPSQSRCPFLQESLVQYCAAGSVMKYVPYSSPSMSRCGNANHKYCDLFLTLQNPSSPTLHRLNVPEHADDGCGETVWVVEGMLTPGWLFYADNHMWADVDKEGHCHIGLDAFFAKVVGNPDRLTFAVATGENHPAVSVEVNGTEFQMAFPRRVNVSSTNSYLRAEPNRIITDPYTFGWLFEGTIKDNPRFIQGDKPERLIHGQAAHRWMQEEAGRMSDFVHNNLVAGRDLGMVSLADGGVFIDSLLKHLKREEILLLYNEFFSLCPRRIS